MSEAWRLVGGSLVALAVLAWPGATARAASIAYEGFAYPSGSMLQGATGGSGFMGPWVGDGGVTVQGPASLVNSLAQLPTGLLIGGGFNVARTLATPLAQSEFWASFMVEASPANDQVYMGFDVNQAKPVPPALFLTVGRRLGNYYIQFGSNPPVTKAPVSPNGVVDLLIIRVSNTGVVSLWVNKNPLATPPDLVAAIGPPPPFQSVYLQVQPGFLVDEVRIGDTAPDVAAAVAPAVPLPRWTAVTLTLLLAIVGDRLTRRRATG